MKRILSLFSVLFFVTLVTFVMTDLAPSDSAEMYYLSKGITPSEEVLNETRHEMGLDKNIVVRYVDWLNDFVHGDLGYSYHYGQDVNQQMLSKLPNTLKLAIFSFVVVLAFSIPLGIYSATHRHSLINSILKNISFLGLSLPNFWLALLLILLFSVKVQLFPVISGSSLKGLVLPVCCLSFPLICSFRTIKSRLYYWTQSKRNETIRNFIKACFTSCFYDTFFFIRSFYWTFTWWNSNY